MTHRVSHEIFVNVPYLLRVDSDGRFNPLAEPIQRTSSPRPIDDYSVIDAEADNDQILLGVTQWHHIHLEDAFPPFVIQGPDRRSFFLKTGISEDDESKSSFTSVRWLVENPDQIDPKTLERIRFIAETEFARFGLGALQRIVK